jgi:hypothetical protein
MKLFSLKNAVLATAIGVGFSGVAVAQNVNEEYREWQRAQRQAQREYNECLRSGRRDECKDYRQAQRRARQEYRDYQRSSNRTYNNGYYGNNQRVYRVYRNGGYYQTDQRGAELLRQAVNSGYQYGYRQGQTEARYGRGYGYNDDSYYRSGVYGYQGYVDRSQYQYYFQQGYQRGYEDGYNNSFRYGYRSGNSYNILGSILNTILNFANN